MKQLKATLIFICVGHITFAQNDESRLNAAGYGQDKPIAENKTAAGRSKNRRVEMTVRNY